MVAEVRRGVEGWIRTLSLTHTHFVVLQLLSFVLLFEAPQISAYQAPLSSTLFQNSLWFTPWVCVALWPSKSASSFSVRLRSFPASRSFQTSRLCASNDHSIGDSTSASVLPMNIEEWFPFGLTGLIALQFKGLSRVFSSITIWKHQFFRAQPSLLSNSHIHTWLLEKP